MAIPTSMYCCTVALRSFMSKYIQYNWLDCVSCASSRLNEGVMAEHTPPLESSQLLSQDLPLLTPPPPQPQPSMVNGDGSQQVGTPGSDLQTAKINDSVCIQHIFIVRWSCFVFVWRTLLWFPHCSLLLVWKHSIKKTFFFFAHLMNRKDVEWGCYGVTVYNQLPHHWLSQNTI